MYVYACAANFDRDYESSVIPPDIPVKQHTVSRLLMQTLFPEKTFFQIVLLSWTQIANCINDHLSCQNVYHDAFYDVIKIMTLCFCLGKNPTDEYLDAMMNEAPGPINFTMFLTIFGEKLNGTDPEDVIRNAFACFDEEATGKSEVAFNYELIIVWL